MPELSLKDRDKLVALEQKFELARQKLIPALRFAELVCIYWPEPVGTICYAATQIDEVLGFKNILAALAPYGITDLQAKLITSSSSPFADLPQTAAISDDSVEYNFSDLQCEISKLCFEFGQGLQVRVFSYYPDAPDGGLLLEAFTGTLRAPKDANGQQLKLSATAGFRSAKLLLPRRLAIPGCMFIYGGLLSSQAEIDLHKGCPYNAHLTDEERGAAPLIGVPGLPDCARDSVETCFAHLLTKRFFPGFKTILDTVVIGQTKGPNLPATAHGNENTLTDPIRSVYGQRFLKALRLLAYRVELDTNHPEGGALAALFEIGEGAMNSLWNAAINNQIVGFQHLNLRFGDLGQSPTGFSPNIGTYSGTAVFFGRIQGDFRGATAGNISGSIWAQGHKDIRVYSTPDAFVEQYTIAPGMCLLDMLENKRWGYGEDYGRYDIQSFIDADAWLAQTVSVTDPNGNVFTGTRGTCNVELTGRATQTQIEDFCTAHRISPPFEHNGLKMIVPLKRETIDDSIPLFTDIGEDANICVDSKGRPIFSWSYVGDDELPNQYTVTFDDESNGFNSTPLIFGDQRQQLAAGKAWGDMSIRIINKDIPAFGVTNFQEAARLGNSLLALGPLDKGGTQNNFSVKLTNWFSQCLEVRMYKLVRLRIRALNQLFDSLGIAGFEYFRVLGKKRKGNLQVELTLQAYPVDYYEHMETVVDTIGGGGDGNLGGGRGDLPCSIAFNALSHTSDTISVALEVC